ncbi:MULTISPECIES: response regulator [unclassified Rhizobium]|jgi:CheY-like chemotaxis protein|uniref:response regulator n=1 Tax=unclassified Rhizobium TaxID=2613769 RepID=UPI000DB9228C|nr:response regulator [Rhizobium sp. AN80A]
MPTDQIVVLVVDDELILRLSISAELEDEGFVVFEAGTADEAIATLERHPEIRLVFTDVDMPGSMDGLKLAAFVRDRWPPIKIIVTSGYRQPEIGQLPQGSPFLTKPYASTDVATMIRGLLMG